MTRNDRTNAKNGTSIASLAALAMRRVAMSGMERIAGAVWQRHLAGTPTRILFAPESLVDCDPDIAADIYAGVFMLEGETLDAAGESPFAMKPPSERFAKALHGFGWLVHLEANPTELASTNARALVEEWLSAKSANSPAAQSAEVVAERLTAWLVVSPLLLSGAPSTFRTAFLRALGRHMRRLERLIGALPHSLEKARAAAALALCATVVSDQTRVQRWALSLLADTLRAQMLPDGGHASRRPEALQELLSPLVVLRDALERRQQPIPGELTGAIDKGLPMLRFFQRANGDLCAFHGTGAVSAQALSALLEYDDTHGHASENARYSGFQRIAAGRSVLLVDTGTAPSPAFAQKACASALAVDFSHGPNRLFGSCGALGEARAQWDGAARASAAQSTLSLGDRSSARILTTWPLSTALGPVLYRGPHTVDVERDGLSVTASHDGYQSDYGIIHERTLTLSADGVWLEGVDRLIGEGKLTASVYALRFHLAPQVRVRLDKARRTAMLRFSDGAIWLFTVEVGPGLAVEESIVLTGPRQVRRSAQFVIAGNTLTDDLVRWHIARHAEPLAAPDPQEAP